MLNFNDFQDIISNKSFDEQSEDMMSFLNVSNFHFEDCFTKIFSKNNLIDIDSDNEAENKTKNPIKNESNYSFSSKEKFLQLITKCSKLLNLISIFNFVT